MDSHMRQETMKLATVLKNFSSSSMLGKTNKITQYYFPRRDITNTLLQRILKYGFSVSFRVSLKINNAPNEWQICIDNNFINLFVFEAIIFLELKLRKGAKRFFFLISVWDSLTGYTYCKCMFQPLSFGLHNHKKHVVFSPPFHKCRPPVTTASSPAIPFHHFTCDKYYGA